MAIDPRMLDRLRSQIPQKGFVPSPGHPSPGMPLPPVAHPLYGVPPRPPVMPPFPGDGRIHLAYGVPRIPVPPGWSNIAPPGVKTQPKLPAGLIWITNVNTGQTKVMPGKQ